MGPRGRNVLIQRHPQAPVLTKDGVTVAQSIALEHPIENMGVQLVKEVSSNVATVAGDGTTTATVLTNSIFQEGLRNVAAGANPVEMKRGMDNAVEQIIKHLTDASKKVEGEDGLTQVATISANSDSTIGKMISEAMSKVGEDGVITVEEASGVEDELEIIEGMKLDRGYLSPHFTNNPEKGTAELENPYILVCDEKIATLGEIIPILEKVQETGRPLLILVEDIDNEPLSTLVVNKIRGILNIYMVKAPGFGEGRVDNMNDIAILSGATYFGEGSGRTLTTAVLDDLGASKKVVIDKDSTIIIGGMGEVGAVDKKVVELKAQIEAGGSSTFGLEKLKKRLAKLSGGVAVIKVGAPTETEMKEKKDRVDDALAATKAAVEEGIVIGGGAALIRAAQKVDLIDMTADERTGAILILNAIKAPAKQIAENAGFDSGVVVNTIQKSESETIGFDASSGEYVEMFEAGIIDPLKVERVALTNAASAASMLLTTEATVHEIVKE